MRLPPESQHSLAWAPARRRVGLLATVLVVLLGAVAEPAPAQTATVPAKSCQAAEHRQFDFWVGRWDVFVASGKKAGESRVELIADGCALLEEWSGGGGVTGKSLNIYSGADHQWH